MIAWISNSHKHPKSFTLTEEQILEWKKYQNKKDHMKCYENNTRCADEEECEINADELNSKYVEMNRG